jgi:hypothetical protein
VVAAVKPDGAFTAATTIPRATAAGTYTITGRCGGSNLGVSATLVVRAVATIISPSLVPLGSHQFGRLRAPDAIVARAGADDVGFWAPPAGQDGAPFGRGRSTSLATARSGCWTRSTTGCWYGSPVMKGAQTWTWP